MARKAKSKSKSRSKIKILAGGAGLLLIIILAAFLGLRWAARQAPDFYEQTLSLDAPTNAQHTAAEQFAQHTAHLVRQLQYSRRWEEEFSQSRVNAWLAHELPRRYGAYIPPGVTDPRVQFEDGLVSFACRVDNTRFRGIISLVVRPKVIGPNRLTITVESLAAGLLPLRASAFTDNISTYLTRFGVLHWWQFAEGHPILHVRINPNRLNEPVLEEIEIDDQQLRISGHREEVPTLSMR